MTNSDDNNNNANDDFLMENWLPGDRDPENLDFTGAAGLNENVNIPNAPTCYDYFSLFVDDEIFLVMATETNRYAEEYLANDAVNLRLNSRCKKWKETTPDEMKLFIAITIAMGIITRLDTSEYWTTDEVLFL